MDGLTMHRWHFAFTITYHYIFPQLTMGLALLIVLLKTMALRTGDEHYNRQRALLGEDLRDQFRHGGRDRNPDGVSVRHQLGAILRGCRRGHWTNAGHGGRFLLLSGIARSWGSFSYGEKRLGPRGHWFAAFMVFLGSWLSGYFIIATDAWMQHPVGYTLGPTGEILLSSFWALLFNPWVGWQYLHNMIGAVVTGCFVMAAVGAFYLLSGKHEDYGRLLCASASWWVWLPRF